MKKPRKLPLKLPWRAPAAVGGAAAGVAPAFGNSAALLLVDGRIQLAVLASLLLHGALLSVNFALPEAVRPDNRDASLEVVLVNASHTRAPEQAQLLAQANLDGGGSTEADVRPTTPVPPQPVKRDGDALVDARQRTETPPESPRQAVLTRKQAEQKVAEAPRTPTPETPPPATPRPSGLDLLDSVAAAVELEAQIDRSLNEYAKRPRKQFIGARTREYRFARYVEDWRQKIERIGTLNYPEAARGRLYGSLLLSVVIRADGSLERVEVQRSSGQKVLDDAAVRIVHMAAPFAAFPPDIRSDTDIIEITRTWTFTNSDRLSGQ